jgi:hypothetical protein
MGLGLVKGIGVSLDVEDDGGGVIPESRSSDDVSTLGPSEGLRRIAGLPTLRPSARGGGLIGETGGDRGEGIIGEGERGIFGTSGGVNTSSLESDGDPGDFVREGCGLLNPLASADSLSPIPREALRDRPVGESASLTTSGESLRGSEVRMGRVIFPLTNSPISIRGFGRRAGESGARDTAIREDSGRSSDDDDDDDDSEGVEAREMARED